jgi:hypothetical protein
VYLRSCCFIHEIPKQGECIDKKRFVVVKTNGKGANEKAWEPPKGQAEYKDFAKFPDKPILDLLKLNVRRSIQKWFKFIFLIRDQNFQKI